MTYKIVIDAGHGGRDPGAVYNGRQEKDDVLELALAVGRILENSGLDVEYTRTTDVYESPSEKAREANNAGADFFVSIHRNSFPRPNEVSGVETLVYDASGIKNQMAENVNRQLENIGFRNLGVKERPNLTVLRRTQMPAILVEAGFINSDIDNQLFDDNFQAIAQGIADGILETIGIGPSGTMGRVYTVQTGAFRNEEYAREMLDRLLSQNYPAFISEGGGYYRVQVGSFGSLAEARNMEQRLRRSGYPTAIIG